MGDKKIKAPNIRFTGFTDDWEQRKVGEISKSIEYGLNASSKEFDGKNKYIRITDINDDSHNFVVEDATSPDTDLSNADNYKLSVGDILFARTGASVGKSYIYKESDGVVYYAGFLIRARIKEDYNPEFIFQNTLTEDYKKYITITSQRSGQPGVNAKEYSEYKIFVPKLPEQDKIGSFLNNLDNFITLHQRKLDLLKVTKKSMLQKMFPKYGANVPEIRFAGFVDAWEQCKLGDYIIPYNDVTTENNQYPVFTSSRKGLFFQTDYYDGNQIASEDNTGYNIVPRGYFTYRHMSDDLVFKFNINNLADNGIVSTLYPVFTTTESLDSKYLQYQLNEGEEFKRFAILQKQGGSRTYMYLSKLKDMILTMPILDEQIKISTFFKQLDDTITLHQRELDLLKDLKKSMLQQMFI